MDLKTFKVKDVSCSRCGLGPAPWDDLGTLAEVTQWASEHRCLVLPEEVMRRAGDAAQRVLVPGTATATRAKIREVLDAALAEVWPDIVTVVLGTERDRAEREREERNDGS